MKNLKLVNNEIVSTRKRSDESKQRDNFESSSQVSYDSKNITGSQTSVWEPHKGKNYA